MRPKFYYFFLMVSLFIDWKRPHTWTEGTLKLSHVHPQSSSHQKFCLLQLVSSCGPVAFFLVLVPGKTTFQFRSCHVLFRAFSATCATSSFLFHSCHVLLSPIFLEFLSELNLTLYQKVWSCLYHNLNTLKIT